MSKLPSTIRFPNTDEIKSLDDAKRQLKLMLDEIQRMHTLVRDALNNPREITDDPTVTATYGRKGEVVIYNDNFYGKTTDTGKDTDWTQIN